ncbi:MAG: ABC transporter ATP-binding protein [Desulfobacteria bacterium]
MLKLQAIDIFYGDIQALWRISLHVEEGELVAVVGSNGAGKSTILKTIAGLIRPRNGSVEFEGKRIDGLAPDKIVRAGISMVPEGRELFPRMTVRENLELGAAYISSARAQAGRSIEHVHDLFPVLAQRAGQLAGTLSGGEQQMVAIGRALMAKPRILIMDEPSLGLAPLMVEEVFRAARTVNREGVTVILVEQNVRQSLKFAHRGYVLENGRIVMEGTGKELSENRHVKEAYLGL